MQLSINQTKYPFPVSTDLIHIILNVVDVFLPPYFQTGVVS